MSTRASVAERLRTEPPAVSVDDAFAERLAALSRASTPAAVPASRTPLRVTAAAAGVLAASVGVAWAASQLVGPDPASPTPLDQRIEDTDRPAVPDEVGSDTAVDDRQRAPRDEQRARDGSARGAAAEGAATPPLETTSPQPAEPVRPEQPVGPTSPHSAGPDSPDLDDSDDPDDTEDDHDQDDDSQAGDGPDAEDDADGDEGDDDAGD